MTTVTIENAKGAKKELEAADLIGSEKQIVCANKVRAEFFDQMTWNLGSVWASYKSTRTPREFQAICIQAQDFFLAQTDASFWIDSQDSTSETLRSVIGQFAN